MFNLICTLKSFNLSLYSSMKNLFGTITDILFFLHISISCAYPNTKISDLILCFLSLNASSMLDTPKKSIPASSK